MRDGLYKVEFHTVHGSGNGVLYATSGKIRGGNSGSAFIGTYTGKGDEIFVAGENDMIRNRYKIIRIGVNSAVVEDTTNKNQQTLPLVEELGS